MHTCGGSLPGSLPSPTRSQPQTRSAACWAHVVPGALPELPPPVLTQNLVGSYCLTLTAYNQPPPNLGKSKSGAKPTVGPAQAIWDPAQLSSPVQFLVVFCEKGPVLKSRDWTEICCDFAKSPGTFWTCFSSVKWVVQSFSLTSKECKTKG